MPLQDLTPQLRTRLRRVEKVVGWFVILAVIILIAGFAYYIYATAQHRGWLLTRINFATGINDASGLNPSDPVKLMGFTVGEVTAVRPNDPDKARGVTICFNIRQNTDPKLPAYYDYVAWDSKVRVVSDFLGHRFLQVEKGKLGLRAVTNINHQLFVMKRREAYDKFTKMFAEFRAIPENNFMAADLATNIVTSNLMDYINTNFETYYTNAKRAGFTSDINLSKTNYYYIPSIDAPAIGDRLDAVAQQIESAMPNILKLTNQLASVLSNANLTVVQMTAALSQTRPTLTNLAVITGNLKDPKGSLGNWILPTNISADLDRTLQIAHDTLQTAQNTVGDTDTNITMLATNLDQTLTHLADLTSNLAWQVSVNTNLVTDINATILHADDLIQGLKKEWYLRGPFKKKKTDQTPPKK